MNLWQLKVFCKVIELGGFSKAAKAIHLSQPTVSSHIKDLERYFEVILIDRIENRAVPTKAGEILLEYAKRMLHLQQETELMMSGYLGHHKGKLAIGGSTIPGGFLLPRILGEFRKQYPDIVISMEVGDTGSIIESVLDCRIEAGIVGAKSDSKKISHTKLFGDKLMLIVPTSHRWSSQPSIDIEDLKGEPFITREKGSGTLKTILNSFPKKKLSANQLNVVAEVGNTIAVIQGIKNRLGVSILSTVAVEDDLKAGSLIAIDINGLDLTRNFYLIRRKDRAVLPLCRVFIDFLKQYDNSVQ